MIIIFIEDNNKNQSPSHESNIGTSLNHEKHYNDQLRAHNESTESHREYFFLVVELNLKSHL